MVHLNRQPKYEAENCLKLPIFILNQKHGIRDGIENYIQWSMQGFKQTIDYSIYWYEGVYYFRLRDSKVTDIELTRTNCNFGGDRFWFICPGLSEDKPCGKRVGVLYRPLHAEIFACRHCHNLTYQSSKKSGNARTFSKTITDLEEMMEKIKRRWYAGKATKKYRRFLKEKDRTNNSMRTFKLKGFK